MFCTNCGKEVKEGSNFCENCGAEIKNQSTPMVEQADPPAQGKSGNTNTGDHHRSIASSIITLAVVVGIILIVLNAGRALLGKGKELKAAEKQVISLVTQNYGTIPAVQSEVLKDIGNHVLVIVKFEVEVSGTVLDGSYLVDVSDTNQIMLRRSDELPKDYDYEGNLDEIIAIWGI